MKSLFSVILLLITTIVYSQQIPHTGCHMGTKECLEIKQRLLKNRQNVSNQAIQQIRSQATTWLPISFHVVGDNVGDYYADTSQLDASVCELNTNFANQNIQFYVHSVTYLNDSLLDYNPLDSIAQASVIPLKIPNTINILVTRNQLYKAVYNVDISLYSIPGDFLIFDQDLLTRYNISTHEMGHFFSLLHTFLGWEYQTGADYVSYLGNPAPDSFYIPDFGGVYIPVENVTRTGPNANCSTAGDGFCDTEADYVNVAISCPMVDDLRDPLNVPINPDEGNVMSYYLCKSYFSPEQEAAIAADIVSRGWTNLSNPNVTTIDTVGLQAVQPLDSQVVSVAASVMTLEWSPILGATSYELILSRKHPTLPFSFTVLDTTFTTTGNSMTFNTNLLIDGLTYTWKVKGSNSYYKCSPFSKLFSFETSTLSSVLPVKKSNLDFRTIVHPNSMECIVTASTITSGTIYLYNALGQVLVSSPIELSNGAQIIYLPKQNLQSGIYIVTLQTADKELVTKKIIINN